MPEVSSRRSIWSMVHAERAALADELAELDQDQWCQPSLCGRWIIEEVVAHLTAAASIGRLRWIASVLGAQFNFNLHNDRRLAEYRGGNPAETLERFRRVSNSTAAPSRHTAAWLGEVVVHGQDIRSPLGLVRTPALDAVTAVARFYASRDFTVTSRSATAGAHLQATDGPFASGSGALVRGTTLALTMAMAGRAEYCDDLTGPALSTIRERCTHAE
jgi:uncharacterized protein (TIGR03083 family)